MIGTDENRAVLHVEVIFWSGKRKTSPSLVSGKYSPHFRSVYKELHTNHGTGLLTTNKG